MRIQQTWKVLFLLCGIVAVPWMPVAGEAATLPSQSQRVDTDWDSLNNEIKIGSGLAAQVQASLLLLRDPAANEYVEKLTRKLSGPCNLPLPVMVKIIDERTIDGFALPG